MEVVPESVVADRLRALGGSEPRVVVSGNYATPWELVRILDGTLANCRVFVMNPQSGWPQRDGWITETPFVGAGARHENNVDYLPMRLSLVPRLFGTVRPPDAVLIHTSRPRGGRVSLGIEVNVLPAAIESVRRRGGLIVAQVNSQMPYTRGDAEIDVDLIDLALDCDGPLPSPATRILDDGALAIGESVSRLAGDGGTLQMGIGQLPDAVAHHLRDKRHLGVWSELVSDGVMQLELAGALNPSRSVVATFLFGSPELYAWADDNPRLTMLRTETVNDPAQIAARPAMLSINTALQVDLYAQANASYVRGSIYSGFGGQPDFVSGALHSSGGQAVIVMRSWHDKSGSSNVVPVLDAPVCSFQHSVIVSENGMAQILGRSQFAQARLLIEEVAHPRAREDLWAAADKLGLCRS